MRVFLSYSTHDFEAADKLQCELKARHPDLDIYFAPRRNELGAYWIDRLRQELEAADAVILLIGRRVGPWQELEYFDALKRNRQSGRPLITPILLTDVAPGLPFFDQFHRLSLCDQAYDHLVDVILQALDGASIGDTTPPWRQVNPYRGLLAMDAQDAAFFFGREALTGEILTRIESHPDRIHALVGNSGVGKSSLAMAGVLANLRSQIRPEDKDHEWSAALALSHTWPVVILKPGEVPVKALAQALAALWLESPAEIEEEALKWRRLLMEESTLPALVEAVLTKVSEQLQAETPQRLILYVDQAEELYSRSEKAEALRFSELIAEAVDNDALIILTSLRSDYYGHLQEDRTLFIASDIIDVPPLGQSDIEHRFSLLSKPP